MSDQEDPTDERGNPEPPSISAVNEQEHAKPDKTKATPKPQQSNEPWSLDQKLNAWLLATAVGVGVIALMQWGLTREQIYTGQRAYIHVSVGTLSEPLTIGKPVLVQYVVKNTGQTPARAVVIAPDLVLSAVEPSFTVPSDAPPPSLLVLGSGEQTGIQQAWLDKRPERLWTEDDVVLVQRGFRLYVRIIVEYETMFHARGRTTICGYLDAGTFTACAFGNEIH